MARGIKIYEVFRASCIPYDDIIERGLTKDGGNICAEISGLIRSLASYAVSTDFLVISSHT